MRQDPTNSFRISSSDGLAGLGTFAFWPMADGSIANWESRRRANGVIRANGGNRMEGLLGSRVKDEKDSKDERDQALQGPRGLDALRLRVGLRSFGLLSVPREALSIRSIARVRIDESLIDAWK
jgi:hypothetical protein